MWVRLICMFVFLLLVACALLAPSQQSLAIDNHGSGRWGFNNADYTSCRTVQTLPLLRSPENSPYRVGKKYNDKGVA